MRRASVISSLSAVVLLAVVARVAAAWYWSDNLGDDRDVYLALARGLVEGRGFSSPDSTVPTAYRPPLYPLLLAATGGARSTLAVAVLHVVLGAATVAFTFDAARRLQLGQSAALTAAALVALDPLLLLYTSFPMTETLCTCLLTAWLCATLRVHSTPGTSQLGWSIACGVLLGLAALCRPTVWAAAVLIGGAWLWQLWRRHRAALRTNATIGMAPAVSARSIAVIVVMAGLTVAPWAVRNWKVFGRPIVTTTHGGYTLLLGNNPAYYEEVVQQSFRTTWDGSHGPGQGAWAAAINRKLEAAGLFGEVERDRWMSRRAWSHIFAHPGLFARACVRRVLDFWSVTPRGAAGSGLPHLVRFSVGAWYFLLFAAALLGVFRCGIRSSAARRSLWRIPVLLIAGFVLVHLVYWSDARMRAPVTPAVAVLAVCGVRQPARSDHE